MNGAEIKSLWLNPHSELRTNRRLPVWFLGALSLPCLQECGVGLVQDYDYGDDDGRLRNFMLSYHVSWLEINENVEPRMTQNRRPLWG